MRFPAVATVVAAVVAVPLLAGCGGRAGSSPTTTTIAPQSGAVAVQALDNRFEARTITITAGSTVTWTNDGSNTHDVVPVEGTDFGVKPDGFKPDATYAATFATPGTYAYYCSLHGTATRGMTGTVVVVAP
ncbi:MAG: cupredoxin domain-containing protein [Acidimicrobiales bacterium]